MKLELSYDEVYEIMYMVPRLMKLDWR